MSTPIGTILLVPLDERPVNTRYPQMLGEIAGAQVLLPPIGIRGFLRQPADLAGLDRWLQESVKRSEQSTVLVSCDTLGYGNLINSRISNDSASAVIARLAQLEEIGAHASVHAFSIITRVSNANDNVEEPLYWIERGEAYYAYSRLTHKAESEKLSKDEKSELANLVGLFPALEKTDWLVRRLRNHTVNLALMDMAARGRIESLLLTSDDTAPYGFPTRERDWLAKWRELIGEAALYRIPMHPGADEVASALVAGTINESCGDPPKIWIDYAIPDDKTVVALYEDRPIADTVAGQIEACGCEIASSAEQADIVLGVVTPSPRRIDYVASVAQQDEAARAPFYQSFIKRLADFQSQEKPVALADVAFPNGSDAQMSALILEGSTALDLGKLAAYGAWNTAGNTLGTVIAQASLSLQIGEDARRASAERLFLAHRFVEDYGYQQIVRRKARDFAEKNWGRREPDPKSVDEQTQICEYIEEELAHILNTLQTRGVGIGIGIAPGSVRLPWRRTFEVDFDLVDGVKIESAAV